MTASVETELQNIRPCLGDYGLNGRSNAFVGQLLAVTNVVRIKLPTALLKRSGHEVGPICERFATPFKKYMKILMVLTSYDELGNTGRAPVSEQSRSLGVRSQAHEQAHRPKDRI